MIGTIRWNFIIGAVSFVLTFCISIFNNIWLTTLLNSLYSFIILFIVVFFCRWVLGTIAGINHFEVSESLSHESEEEEHKGTALDISTPDEEADLHEMLKGSLHSDRPDGAAVFTPLNPPKLSSKSNLDAGELAQAVRHMTEE